MPLPASGSISMNQVNVELGSAGTTQRALNDTPVRTLFGKASGQIAMNDGWGKSSGPTPGTYYSSHGGYYTGIQSGYYLFVTTTDCIRQYKTTDTFTSNASSETDGYTNTMCNANATHPAFQYADNLSAGGYSDWYVGSPCETKQQWCYRSCGSIPAYGTNCRYWTSREGGYCRHAWQIAFDAGGTPASGFSKTSCFRVRPIRRCLTPP